MSGQISHAFNTSIGGNTEWSYSHQVGAGLARTMGLHLGPREASDLAHLAGLLSVVGARSTGVSWRGALVCTAVLSLLFWSLAREQG
jgi:hypothetical protein